MPQSSKQKFEKRGDTFPKKQNLQKHMNNHKTSHRGKSDNECRKCEQTFKTEQKLTDHDNREHKENNPIKCKLCNTSSEASIVHLQALYGIGKDTFLFDKLKIQSPLLRES